MTRAEERRIYLPPWRVDVAIRSGVPPVVPVRTLARVIATALETAGAPSPASIGLILSDDAELARLNATHMGQHGPTDVLSFPLLEPEFFPPQPGRVDRPRAVTSQEFRLPPGRRPHLGDVVVSVERAIAQATSGTGGQTSDVSWSPADELRLLVVHGTLHICGWDHSNPVEEAAMRSLERGILGVSVRSD
jgi:probable rRNA maturation factor